jgi:membrane protease YdiL (CAAX protease family)
MSVENYFGDRETVYPPPGTIPPADTPFERFKRETGNEQFKFSGFTVFSLLLLLVAYPGVQLLGNGMDPTQMLKSLDQTMIMILLIVTVIVQWGIFLINYLSLYFEKTGLAGVGVKRIRGVDFAWTVAFLLAAVAIISGLEWFLGEIGIPVSGDVGLLIPKDPAGKVLWVLVAWTAGFCEEVAFRGYVLTRLRLLGRFNSWWIPILISSLAFGACHTYQGLAGFIVITIYGAMFGLLYIRTGSLWPCILAHFLWDFGALFYLK